MSKPKSQSNFQPPSADLRVRTYVSRWFHALLALDGPMWKALRGLVVCPGDMARVHVESMTAQGSTKGHVHPIRLYLTINVVFFLLAPFAHSSQISLWQVEHASAIRWQPMFEPLLQQTIERSRFDDECVRALLDQRIRFQQGAWVWLFIPCLAAATMLVARKVRPFFVQHLVLATYLVAFSLLAILVLGLLGRLIDGLAAGHGDVGPWVRGGAALWMIWLMATFYRSTRIFFDMGRIKAVLLSLWLFAVLSNFAFWVYIQVLFLVSLQGLGGSESVV